LIGAPNSGKSQLLASLTRAHPEIAEYPFTTREPLPGMMPWEDVFIQLVDTPAITPDLYAPEVQAMMRSAELVLLVVDLGSDDGGQEMLDVWNTVQDSRTRLAENSWLDQDDIGISYTAAIIVLNKSDDPDSADRRQFFQEYLPEGLPQFVISAQEGTGLDELKAESLVLTVQNELASWSV